MAWTEAEVDDLIEQVQRDFALGRFFPRFHKKLREHGVTIKHAEKAIGKHSYIGLYENEGRTIGFLNPRNNIFVAWSMDDYPTFVKTCFIAKPGVRYLLKQPECELIWSPK
ncbi:hypothetical protein HUU40_16675 [candidate division KSB1 bacterium]|nr:hypothetical protein [candidate division KSB1 bacterium]